MRVVLVMLSGTRNVTPPDNITSAATCEGECPSCREPLRIVGKNKRVVDDHYYAADGYCVCGAHVGEIRAHPDTLFGIEEDDRVLNGRARVY